MNSKLRRAFTLIELLVVIAIIGILSTILIPTINSTVRRSRRESCASNLKQIGQARVLLYQMNNDWLPNLPIGKLDGAAAGLMIEQVNCDPELFDCPSNKQRPPTDGIIATRDVNSFTDYSFSTNAFAFGNVKRRQEYLSDLSTLRFAFDRIVSGAHEDGRNVVYMDGHVGFVNEKD